MENGIMRNMWGAGGGGVGGGGGGDNMLNGLWQISNENSQGWMKSCPNFILWLALVLVVLSVTVLMPKDTSAHAAILNHANYADVRASSHYQPTVVFPSSTLLAVSTSTKRLPMAKSMNRRFSQIERTIVKHAEGTQ
jgi:hypothetical protein